MRRKYRIISTIVLICFIFNATVQDIVFGQSLNYKPNLDKLAPPLKFDDLAGSQAQDMGRVEYLLYLQLVASAGNADTITVKDLMRKADEYRDSIYKMPVQFFVHECEPLSHDYWRVMCRIKNRTYYAVFSTKKDIQTQAFPIEVYTKKEWEKEGVERVIVDTGMIPRRKHAKADDARAIARYVQHEKGIDTVIRYAHEHGLAKRPSEENFYKKTIGLLSEKLLVKPRKSWGIPRIEDREFFLVPLTEEIRKMKDELPRAKVIDKNGVEYEVEYYAHSSNKAVHIFIDKEDFDIMMKPEIRTVADETDRALAVAYIYRKLAHEMGDILGLEVVEVKKDIDGKYLVINKLDQRCDEWFSKEKVQGDPKDLRLKLKVVDLDTNLKTRDYAAGKEKIPSPGNRELITKKTRLKPAEDGKIYIWNAQHGVGILIKNNIRDKEDPFVIVEFYNRDAQPYPARFGSASILTALVDPIYIATPRDIKELNEFIPKARALAEARREKEEKERAKRNAIRKAKLDKWGKRLIREAKKTLFAHHDPSENFISSLTFEALRRFVSAYPSYDGAELGKANRAIKTIWRRAKERQNKWYTIDNASDVEQFVIWKLLRMFNPEHPCWYKEEVIEKRKEEAASRLRAELDEEGRISKETEDAIVNEFLAGTRPRMTDRWFEWFKEKKSSYTTEEIAKEMERWIRKAIPIVEIILHQELPESGINPRLGKNYARPPYYDSEIFRTESDPVYSSLIKSFEGKDLPPQVQFDAVYNAVKEKFPEIAQAMDELRHLIYETDPARRLEAIEESDIESYKKKFLRLAFFTPREDSDRPKGPRTPGGRPPKAPGSPEDALLIFAKNPEVFFKPQGFTKKIHKIYADKIGKIAERTRQDDRKALMDAGYLTMPEDGHYVLTPRGILEGLSLLCLEGHKENLGKVEVIPSVDIEPKGVFTYNNLYEILSWDLNPDKTSWNRVFTKKEGERAKKAYEKALGMAMHFPDIGSVIDSSGKTLHEAVLKYAASNAVYAKKIEEVKVSPKASRVARPASRPEPAKSKKPVRRIAIKEPSPQQRRNVSLAELPIHPLDNALIRMALDYSEKGLIKGFVDKREEKDDKEPVIYWLGDESGNTSFLDIFNRLVYANAEASGRKSANLDDEIAVVDKMIKTADEAGNDGTDERGKFDRDPRKYIRELKKSLLLQIDHFGVDNTNNIYIMSAYRNNSVICNKIINHARLERAIHRYVIEEIFKTKDGRKDIDRYIFWRKGITEEENIEIPKIKVEVLTIESRLKRTRLVTETFDIGMKSKAMTYNEFAQRAHDKANENYTLPGTSAKVEWKRKYRKPKDGEVPVAGAVYTTKLPKQQQESIRSSPYFIGMSMGGTKLYAALYKASASGKPELIGSRSVVWQEAFKLAEPKDVADPARAPRRLR